MKRRVFLGLPVILGILFYIWYIFHASDNVAYSDYIRLVNSYLPDVTNPAKFFVPDILTRVPITYLGRIINVKLFGYNTYFDMILGVLSLGAVRISARVVHAFPKTVSTVNASIQTFKSVRAARFSGTRVFALSASVSCAFSRHTNQRGKPFKTKANDRDRRTADSLAYHEALFPVWIQ